MCCVFFLRQILYETAETTIPSEWGRTSVFSIQLSSLSPMITQSLIWGLAHHHGRQHYIYQTPLLDVAMWQVLVMCIPLPEPTFLLPPFLLLLRGRRDDQCSSWTVRTRKHSGDNSMENWKQRVPQFWLYSHLPFLNCLNPDIYAKKKKNPERIVIFKISVMNTHA